jgi:dCMP deaminase
MHDLEALRAACEYATRYSDDPNTKNGAVLVTATDRVYAANTLPHGVHRDVARLEPPTKYRFIEHAERGVIYKAASRGVATAGRRLYCPWYACTDCARAIICAGIVEVVGIASLRAATPDRWEGEILLAEQMLREAGVGMRWITEPIGAVVRFDGKDVCV